MPLAETHETVLTHQVSTLKPLVSTVFLPAAVFGIGQGAAAPIISLTAISMGASIWIAAFIVSLTGAGLLLADLPSGKIVSKLGERRAVVLGSTVGAIGVSISLSAPNLWFLGIGVLITGSSVSLWSLARQSYLASAVDIKIRAKAMSSMATSWRSGALLGPFIGAGAVWALGIKGGFIVQFLAIITSGILMARLRDLPQEENKVPGTKPPGLIAMAISNRRLYATLGMGTLFMGAARASRDAVVPLWGEHIGLNATTTSLIFGCAALLEIAISYPAGHFMDRYGRRAIATPSLALLAIAYLLLPLSDSALTLIWVSTLLGIGNGIGNGVIMTIGADVSPPTNKPEFFASWRLLHDGGTFAGPLVIALVATSSLAVAAVSISGAAFIGAGFMWHFIPKYIPHPRPRTKRIQPATNIRRTP